MGKATRRRGTATQRRRGAPRAPAPAPAKHPQADRPTPEMEARVSYQYLPVKDEMGIYLGSAYQRKPLYLIMAERGGITREEAQAITFYRSAFDRSERSATGSCLNMEGGGRGAGATAFMFATPAILEAKRRVAMCEAVLGHTLDTMRAVALHDRGISDVAMERFGCRTQDWIVVTEPVMKPNGKQLVIIGKGPQWRTYRREKLVPRSGRHRAIISDEFHEGLKRLVPAVGSIAAAGEIAELWVQPSDIGEARIRRGMCAPPVTYRLWGSEARVTAVLDVLIRDHGDELRFASAEAATAALAAADDGRLHRLEPEELAR